MEQNDKEMYLTPEVNVFEVRQEGVICASNGQAGVQNYNWNTEYEE
ncbi:MAG: hypothetical protein IJT74_06625 [Bacteroidales bacterium]|nr:hypothetical protein [Bacteroidales bacterium]